MRCECGEEVAGDTCMLCGSHVAQDTGQRAVGPQTASPGDDARRGALGNYLLDISRSIHIMDSSGNTIYDIPYGDAECSMRLGALSIRHAGERISLRGRDAGAWRRAIAYRQSPPVWYLRGDGDCEVLYGGAVLGVTPCVVTPPFSWAAFKNGSYELAVRRPGAKERRKTVPAASGIYPIRCKEGSPATRSGGRPDGERLVLNPGRFLVMAEQPCLTDGRGVTVLRMPGAEAKVGMLKRGATISWDQSGLGWLSVNVKCDSPLKYDRLREMLPQRDAGEQAAESQAPPYVPPPAERQAERQAELLSCTGQPPMGLMPYAEERPDAPRPEKKSWWRRGKKTRWNRGNYEGTDIRITGNDLDTRLGRFDGYSFEAVCANLLAAMGYKIEKGYDAKSGRMLGPTKSDMGVDVMATKNKKRVIVQCKHWKEQCGGPDVNKTLGAASVHGGDSVLMICTGGFTAQAIRITKESSVPVELWDWDTIRTNMRKHLLD